MRAHLRREVPPATYDIWLRRLVVHHLDDERLVIIADDGAARWVSDRFGHVLERAAAHVLGRPVEVDITGRSELARPSPKRSVALSTAQAPAGLNPAYRFEQFVIGEGNRLAHAAALAVAELPGGAYNPLFLYGPPGVGKTHLLHSIAAYVQAAGGGRVACVTADAFTTAFVGALKHGSADAFKSRFRGADVLLVDDVQFLEDKTRTEEELFHTFNALYETGRQLVFTSDRRPRDITALQERLRERFESGLVADIAIPDFPTRLTILRKWACAELEGQITDDALARVAAESHGNVRALQGLLIRVVADASHQDACPDAAFVERFLVATPPSRPQRTPTLDEIQAVVSRACQLTHSELVSQSRQARVVWPRHLAMYLARTSTNATLPAIGRAFGGRHHSTVLSACRTVERRLASDQRARDQAQRLLHMLQAPSGDR